MEVKSFFKVKLGVLITVFFMLVVNFVTDVMAQQFPIGTYWVRIRGYREMYDYYYQVAQCGINIIIGGRYGSATLPTILNYAEAQNIAMIIDGVTDTDSISWYAGADWGTHDRGSYHLPYEPQGYEPIPELQIIEAEATYDFMHEVGEEIADDDALDGSAWYVTPAQGTGMVMHNYSGALWQEPGYTYRATFRMKVDEHNHQDLVATVRIVQGSNNLVEQMIFADDFNADETYQEFEYQFTTLGTPREDEGSYDAITSMIPEGGPYQPTQVTLDYHVEYHGHRTLWVDQVIIENRYGDRLFDGHKNADLLRDTQSAFGWDLGNPTIQGFNADEPPIYGISCARYVNDLIGPTTPARFGFRETIKSTVNHNYNFNRYLAAGLTENQDYKLLVDRYPIEYGSPRPGEAGYNNYIQPRWEYLIEFLEQASFVSTLNGKPFWYTVQAHSWGTWHRDPDPVEIRAMVNLGLVYGAKGIFYFLYTSIPYYNATGLVDINFSRNTKWFEVQQINTDLQTLASTLLNLTWQEAHSIHNDPAPHQYISQLTTTGDSPTETYIELGLFEDSRLDPNVDYFMVVNRRCQNTEARTINITIHKDASTYYFIREMLSGTETLFQTNSSGNYTFTDNLNPGQGKLYMLKKSHTGTITTNQTWYEWEYVTGNVTVNNGVTLTIIPGTTIKFTSATGLKILGTFTATGTSTQHIRFTSSATAPAKGSWAQIKLENSQNTSVLDYCDIEYASIGVWCQGSSLVTLRHLNVNNCKNWGLYLLTNSTNTTVENSSFTNTDDRGIFLYTSSPDLINVTCTNNKYGLFCYNKSEPDIGYSHFSSNTLDGIYCSSTSRPWMYYHSTYFPNRGWNRIRSNTGRGVAAFSSSYPYMGLNSSYPGNNIIEQNGGYEIYNGNTNGWIWAVYNWWETPTGPLPGDLYTDQTVEIDPVNPNPKPTTTMIAGLATLTTDNLANTDSLSDPQKYNLIGTEYLVEGKYLEAKEAFEYVITYYPRTEEAKYALVHITSCYEGLSRISDIVPYLETVSNTYKGSDLEGFALGLSVPYLEKEENYKKAIERCLQIRGFYQDKEVNKNLQFIMANIYFYGLKDDQNAKKYFENYALSYPNDPMASTAQMMLEIMGSRSLPKKQLTETVSVNNLPTDFVLSQNYPNPCNPETEIKYQLPEATTVTLKIYNLMGQEVRTLLNKEEVAGYHVVRWNGKDEQGLVLASGIYIYRIEAGSFAVSKKLALIR